MICLRCNHEVLACLCRDADEVVTIEKLQKAKTMMYAADVNRESFVPSVLMWELKRKYGHLA